MKSKAKNNCLAFSDFNGFHSVLEDILDFFGNDFKQIQNNIMSHNQMLFRLQFSFSRKEPC